MGLTNLLHRKIEVSQNLAKKGYKVEIAIHLQPSNARDIVTDDEMIENRIVLYTQGDMVANKLGQRIKNVDVTINESRTERKDEDYLKYIIKGDDPLVSYDKFTNHYYREGDYDVGSAHGANYYTRGIWESIMKGMTRALILPNTLNNTKVETNHELVILLINEFE